MMKYKKFNLTTVFLTSLFLASVCIFNIVIDPYGIWKIVNKPFVNIFKPVQSDHERLYKAIEIMHIKPQIIFLGTSRTRIGLDPDFFHEGTSQPIYNAGFGSANINEILQYFKHALKNQPNLTQVILGIDIYGFNQFMPNQIDFPAQEMEREWISLQDIVRTTASLDVTRGSYITIRNNFGKVGHTVFEPNGRMSEAQLQDMYKGIKDIPSFTGINKADILNKDKYAIYELSQKRINDYKEIVDICKERGIKLTVFISPSHATDMETIRVAGKWQDFEQLKRVLCAITPIWDFSGYNSITTETIGLSRKYYWDSSHYKKEVGDMILSTITGTNAVAVPSDFGVLITPINVEHHLADITDAREKWVKNNSELVDYIQSLKQ